MTFLDTGSGARDSGRALLAAHSGARARRRLEALEESEGAFTDAHALAGDVSPTLTGF